MAGGRDERRGSSPSIGKTALGYGAMLVGAVLLFFWIRSVGGALVAPDSVGSAGLIPVVPESAIDNLLHVLLALVVIIIAARLAGAAFRRLGQPPVIGEVIAGIVLGPSLLGRVAPDAYAFLLPPSVAPFLQVIAQVGVILYMFLVGLELNPAHLRRSPQRALAISHASIVVPFLLGSALALHLYPRLATGEVSFTAFALFLGVSMSVTAFPVLARILTDRRMQATPIGVLALTCAAVDDVTAWCLLAFVVSVVQARGESALLTLLLTAAYIGFVFVLLRPAMKRIVPWLERKSDFDSGRMSQNSMALVFVLLLASALATESIGIHALFGAFLLGAVMPHDSRFSRELALRLEDLVVVLLLPAFFAYSGMRTQVQLVSGAEQWLLCGLVIAVACIGKFGGTAIAARLSGLPWRDASALGILMNTRGLVELIVLNVGLDLGVISPTLFAMLVVMALVTTLMTSPILALLARSERPSGSPAASAVAP